MRTARINAKLYRVKNGMNQRELADRIGISQAMLSKFERGVSTISGEKLQRMADILKCPVSELAKD